MADPPTSDEGSSDLHLANNELKTPTSVDALVTIAQLPPSIGFPFAPVTPLTKLSGKRKRLKTSRYDFPSNNAEKKRSSSKHKAKHDPSDPPAQISPTMIRAGELQSSLGSDHPTFKKIMLKSHVVSCFWMGLPVPFCRSFLPKQETLMVIEDENGQQYKLKYIAHKTGLSAGWRNFAIIHKLLEGDVLVFQLVESNKFKVYIVRANESKQVDGSRNLLNHNTNKNHKIQAKMVYKRSEPPTQTFELNVNSEVEGGPYQPDLLSKKVKSRLVYKRSEPPTQSSELNVNSDSKGGPHQPDLPSKKVKSRLVYKRSELPTQSSELNVNSDSEGGPHQPYLPVQKVKSKLVYKRSEPPTHLFELTSHVNSEAKGGPHQQALSSKKVKTFKDFRITVNKQCIDSELSEEIRINYYKLCNAKKELLHDNLPEGLYYKLVAGMIGETVNIANAIKNCKPTTTKEEFDAWDSSLKSFELMGMKVGFLRDRIRMLEKAVFDSENVKKYMEAIEERNRNGITMKILEAKIADLKESNRKIDAILGSLKEKVEGNEVVFQEKVNEPW
ncbi:unnamed protein product [Lactuca saligna]|uniref:TF-B3 domain-containing protein n=1 Tax=Lactuca saligna TaxID=75948 RepID=A0AA35Y143_LACSI|nr:unnamed protein product [Lactuca saligna]